MIRKPLVPTGGAIDETCDDMLTADSSDNNPSPIAMPFVCQICVAI